MPKYRCAECGVELKITLKATPHLSEKVIGLVPIHSCIDIKTLIELGITPDPVPLPSQAKFIQNLDRLNKSSAKDFDPGDRRPGDQTRSVAPKNLLDAVKQGKIGGE